MSEHEYFVAKFNHIVQTAENDKIKLANHFREQVLLPLCKEKQSTFRYEFSRSVFRLNGNAYRDGSFDDVYEVLDHLGDGSCFGAYVKEITEEDIKI